jgi:glycosyltransferase involved in cell wall biosynthesis
MPASSSQQQSARTLLIIPIYNEERYLPGVLEEIKKNVSSRTEILAVDDGSTDRSRVVLEATPGVKILSHESNMGYGQTLIDGFRYAIEGGFETAITIDCDWQHEPRFIRDFEREIAFWDIASGSRYLRPSNESPPAKRAEINRKITKIINEATGLSLTDAFCGFKAYRVESLKKLELSETDYGMPLQLWVQAAARNLRVKEIPVGLVYFDHSRAFAGELRNPTQRYRYYLSVIERELAIWKDALPGGK